MKMEGSVRSGGVLKKKSSSGCLIIKKKDESKNSGPLRGFTDSKQKKRPRLAVSYSGSSDEDESLEFIRRKVNNKKISNGSTGCKRSELEGREYDRNNGGMEVSGERKRSRLDLFEFDEYDEFDGKKMRNELVEDRFKMLGHSGSGKSKKFGVGSSDRNAVADKRKQGPYFDGSSDGRGKGVDGGVRDKGFELEDEEVHMPISLLRLKYQGTANEPIRLQGKNGVLKVMVNKKKNMDLPSQHKNYNHREIEERKGSKSENVVKKDTLARLPFYPSSKMPEARGLFVDKEASVEKEKKEVKLEKVKPILTKGSKAKDSAVIRTDTTLKLAPPGGLQASSSKKGVKKEEERFSPPENGTPVKGKEVKEEKFKRGGSTEKQLLREKIRQMLIDSGWTIDYRPRRNRDYLDAVYINPGGTAYWSIIKAYDALKKQLEEDCSKSKQDVGSPSFAPLSDDLLNKLTRQTKKKIEEEMKRKRKVDGMTKSAKCAENSDSDQNEPRLGPHMKHKSRKGKLPEVDQESGDDLSDESPKRKPRKVRVEKSSITSNFNGIQGRTSKIIGRCTLLVRGSDKGENSDSDGYVPYNGKRTVLAWLIDSGSAQLSEKVQYMNRRRTRVLLEGWITRDGIHCGCCSKILTVSKFELHAGSKLRQPFQNIILESGASLLQCQIDAWNRQEESVRRDFHSVDVDGDDPDDDTCGICGDGGDLICCDSCPSTFHQICLEIQMLPSGDWHCPNCTCIYCEDTSLHIAGNNDNAVDEPIRCSFCEKKYHRSCSESVYDVPMSSNNVSICGQKCQELYDHIQKILGVKHELEAGFSWSLIQRMEVSDASHRNFPQRVECNSKLAVALSVMNECFLPIFDRRSGINIIHNVVYNCGSNFNRLNYRGFYTAVLERGDEIISAASIRIHGTRLAEMPFIGTREIYRRQGMCRRLLSAIETALVSLGVEKLIIPAISEHMNTWTTVFSFHQLEDVLKKEIKSMNMLVFPGTDMLQKQLIKHEIFEGMKVFESKKNQLQLHVPLENPAIDSSMELSKQVENDSGVCHETKIYKNVSALDSGSPGSAFPSNDNVAASVSDSLCESDVLLASKGATVISSEVTNKQKESSSGLKCSPTLDVSNIADTENPLPYPPDKDNTDSSTKTIISDACKLTSESPCPESFGDTSDECSNAAENTGSQNLFTSEGSEVAKVQGSVYSSVKVPEDADPEINTIDGCVKSMPGSALDSSAQSTTDKVNGESNHATFPATVINEDLEMNQPTVAFPESGLNSSIEPSPDSFAAINAKVAGTGGIEDLSSIRDANDNNKCDLSASCTKVNPEVSGVQIASVEVINEDQNPLTDYTFLDTGESTMRCNPDLDCTTVLDVDNDIVSGAVQKEVVAHAETDKPNGEMEIPPAVDGELTCPISSHESLAQNTTTSENQPKTS